MMRIIQTLVLLSFGCHQTPAIFPNAYDVLVHLPFFVDKTEMLKLIFDDTESPTRNPFFYITCPRGFGKTINLLMVKSFAEVIVDAKGLPKKYTETETYARFAKLNIAKYPKIMANHMARYPVIILDLSDIFHHGTTVEETCWSLSTILWFELHNYVQFYKLDEHLKRFQKPERQFIRTIQKKNLTVEQVQHGLFRLTKILYDFFNGTQVVVLVDEFDTTATLSMLTTKTYPAESNRIINAMLTHAFTYGRKYIKTVLLTGITTLSYSSDPLKLDNTLHYPFLDDHQFTPYYGLLDTELDGIFDKYSCDETDKRNIRQRFRGYVTPRTRTTIYNAYSIASILMNKANDTPALDDVKNTFRHRTAVGPMSSFLKNAQFRQHIQDLLDNRTICYPISKIHQPDAIDELRTLKARRFADTEPRHVPMFFTFFFETGYFSHGDENQTYVVPNIEVYETLKDILKVYGELNVNVTS